MQINSLDIYFAGSYKICKRIKIFGDIVDIFMSSCVYFVKR